MTERAFNWLTPRVYTTRFQRTHLIVNYSLLALACVLYLMGVVGTAVIAWACLPGALCFFLSFECWAWKLHSEGDIGQAIETLLRNMR